MTFDEIVENALHGSRKEWIRGTPYGDICGYCQQAIDACICYGDETIMDNAASAVIETVARLYDEWLGMDAGQKWPESDYRFAEYLTQNEPTIAAFLAAFAVRDLRAEGLLETPIEEP